ncbi:DNA polymerase III, clamp loader complex, gamma/delta/delta subunit [Aspergillus transmontanensis]|uniref:DNA polymerase III, clamp loader complex, gamma/delta/delta subunit n=1 Tax=Aspergillus transmontanensis TaxID=1034304 RepID=A0A5N6W1G3_9EURO|nr:DNA polymerase III, clamp loader complex, gamma/delta/delta subunit [Aspergillus transmontanensis]
MYEKRKEYSKMVECPICQKTVLLSEINRHLDSGCEAFCENVSSSGLLSCGPNSGCGRPLEVAFISAVDDKERPDRIHHTTPIARPLAKESTKRVFDQQQSCEEEKRDTKTEHTRKRLKPDNAPLAERVRPGSFDDIVGQSHLVGPNGTIRKLVHEDKIANMILWGSSGTGKTTIARIIGDVSRRRFYEIGSTITTVTEYKSIIAKASEDVEKERKPSIVFCDEVHRITRPQQDTLLDAIRTGRIILIGATTENPSLTIRHGLVYKCAVYTLTKPKDADVRNMLHRVVEEQGLHSHLLDDELLEYLSNFADGDCRLSLNLLEIACDLSKREGMTGERLRNSLTMHLNYDRSGDQHYDTISAFHKSIRGSDADAALYYLARMLKSGENPLFIARRLVVATSEDIGLANNVLQTYATSVYSVLEKLDIQDAQASLAQLVIMMCLSKKSTRSYRGLNNAFACLKEPGAANAPIPYQLLPISPETRTMVEEFTTPHAFSKGKETKLLPECLEGRKFLEDTDFLFKRDPDLTYR